MERYALIVTSCDRHDLLKQTLDSFASNAEEEPIETIVVEDSDRPEPDWFRGMNRLGWRKTWLANQGRCGQIYAADRAMQQLVKTKGAVPKFVFWCEDDWMFTKGGFIAPSLDILNKYREIVTVGVRSDWGHPIAYHGNTDLKIAEPYWHGVWGGFMFNPGLRRVEDYKALGSFGRHVSYGLPGLNHEQQLSKKHLDAGFRIAQLPGGYCHHIGGGRSRAAEPLPPQPKLLIAVPACRTFKYTKWESSDSPSYDPTIPAYGTNIHVSGPNPRLAAVRESWWKDVEPFKQHVDAKFFFGQGETAEQADEVVLDIPNDYGALPLKTQAIAQYTVEHDYDFVLKIDDDSYPFMDRVVAEVIANRFDYAGNPNCNLCLGGAGYFMSKRACRIVAAAGKPDHWAEDMWVGTVLNKHNITAFSLPHFTGLSAHYFDLDNIPDNAAIIHAVRPEDMTKVNGKRQINGPLGQI